MQSSNNAVALNDLQLRQVFSRMRTFISSLRMANLSDTALAAVSFKIRFSALTHSLTSNESVLVP